jgi:DNA modification methylase
VRVALSQAALYEAIAPDLELSWSEAELPERERTKHVHRLHPYLGKFIPQLVERLLERYVTPGGHVLDPFAGSGTTLVQALESGYHATGVDIAAFNALLMRVKTREYDEFLLERELRDALGRIRDGNGRNGPSPSGYVHDWFSPRAASELVGFRSLLGEYEHADVLRVVLARAARSARLTRHFDLEFPRAPQREPYWCHKHRRTCRPVGEAGKFLTRYVLDTLARLKEFQRVRARGFAAHVVHGDALEVELAGPYEGVVTSPPYPGLIDYHEQHRYAYELLALDDRRERELGAAAMGTSRRAIDDYVTGISKVFARCVDVLAPGAPVIVVVNDRRDLYPEIFRRAGLLIEERLERHVNRRTGRRAGEYFESVFVARTMRRCAVREA